MNRAYRILSRPRSKLWTVDDFEAVILAEVGFSVATIAAKKRLSKAQVTYRMKLAGVKLRDYRDGKSRVAIMVLSASRKYATDQFVHQVEDHTKKHLQQLGWTNGK